MKEPLEQEPGQTPEEKTPSEPDPGYDNIMEKYMLGSVNPTGKPAGPYDMMDLDEMLDEMSHVDDKRVGAIIIFSTGVTLEEVEQLITDNPAFQEKMDLATIREFNPQEGGPIFTSWDIDKSE